MMPNNNMLMNIQNMMKMGKNPQAIVEQMVQQNPQMRSLVMQVRNSGMTPQQYLDQYAKQNNIQPMVNNMMNFLNGNNHR